MGWHAIIQLILSESFSAKVSRQTMSFYSSNYVYCRTSILPSYI